MLAMSIVVHQLNPIPHRAPFFGYNQHMDQNQKMKMYSCTHVALIDGILLIHLQINHNTKEESNINLMNTSSSNETPLEIYFTLFPNFMICHANSKLPQN